MKTKLLKHLRKNFYVQYEPSVFRWVLADKRHFMNPTIKEDFWILLYHWIGLSYKEKKARKIIKLLMNKVSRSCNN